MCVFQEEQKSKQMVDKITNVLKGTLTHGSSVGVQNARSSYPDGRSIHEEEIPKQTKGASYIVPQKNIGMHMQTGYNVQGNIRPEIGLSGIFLPAGSGIGQSTGKMETCSVAKRARTELLEELNQQ